MPDQFERRDSLRRSAPVKLVPPDGGASVDARGTVSLRGIFFEGTGSLSSSWDGALVAVEAALGGPQPLRAVCLVAARPTGFLLTWQTLDFEAERELARYLDDK